MQAYVEQKLSGSSFVGGYSSCIPAHFDVTRLTVIITQILHRRGFDVHVPAWFPVKCILGINLGLKLSHCVFYCGYAVSERCLLGINHNFGAQRLLVGRSHTRDRPA